MRTHHHPSHTTPQHKPPATTPRQPKPRTATHLAIPRAGTALLAGALLGCAIAAAGCGETTTASTPAAASTQPATSTATTAAASTPPGTTAPTTSPAPTAGRPTTSTPGATRTTSAARRKVHIVLPPPGSHPEHKISAAEQSELPVSDIDLSSPAITAHAGSSNTILAGQYTCSGANQSPPLRWKNIPAGTSELVLFVLASKPAAGKLNFAWALAGINPQLHGLNAGQIPPGATQGQNTTTGHNTYSICPTNTPETYVFTLYALTRRLTPPAGFQPATLREQAIHNSHHVGLLVGTDG